MRTHTRLWTLAFGFSLLGVLSVPALVQEKGGEDLTGPYDVVPNWPKPLGHAGWMWGSQGGVFAENPNRIFVVQRGELPELPPPGPLAPGLFQFPAMPVAATGRVPRMQNCILVFDRAGNLLESWTEHDHLFEGGRGPHKVKISPYDPEHHVWVIDDERQQVFKFTNDGKTLVMTLGVAGVKGEDEAHFGRPTDIAWLPDGTFFISDGYVNTRVVKFDKTGKFLKAWGTPGKGPGQFRLPHAIDIDKQRRIYVADRSNSRVQIFDEEGKYLDEWPDIRSPYHIMMTDDQHLAVSDGVTNRFLTYDLGGHLITGWGSYGSFPGGFWSVHQFSVDDEGNLYAAETFGGRTQKFTPKKGVDRKLLIGSQTKLMPMARASR